MTILFLPFEIYCELQKYLCDHVFRVFLAISKNQYFQLVRKETIFMKLSRICSMKYVENLEFKTNVIESVKNTANQVLLHFTETSFAMSGNRSGERVELKDLSFFQDIGYLALFDCPSLSTCIGLRNIGQIKFHNCPLLEDTSFLFCLLLK
jgi:hypothetical protein